MRKRLQESLARFFYNYIFPFPLWLIYRILSFTWSIQVEESESLRQQIASGSPCLLAHWHGDELALITLVKRYRILTIASTSLDGDMMSKIIRLLGGKTVRGSSTRGGVGALKGLLRLIKLTKMNASFAVDGPKGPRHKAKAGVFEVSKVLQNPIFAIGIHCNRAWIFKRSWNKTYLPKPFAKITCVWSERLGPIMRDQDPHDLQLALSLENALHNAASAANEKLLRNFP